MYNKKESKILERESEIDCDIKLQLLSKGKISIHKLYWVLYPDIKSAPPVEPHNPMQNRV